MSGVVPERKKKSSQAAQRAQSFKSESFRAESFDSDQFSNETLPSE